MQNLRYGLRMLLKKPGFTAIALITLALGIGANSAVFSVVNAVLLRPLPYPHAERLVYVWEARRSSAEDRSSMTPYNFTAVREQSQSFDGYFAFRSSSYALTGDGMPESLSAVDASGDFGRTIGVAPALGRIFTAEEDLPGKDDVAVISDGLWKRRFGASQEIIGQRLLLNGESRTIIGVMPAGFDFPNWGVEVWVPLALDLSKYQRGTAFLQGVARLKAGVGLKQASGDLFAIAGQLEHDYPDNNRDVTFRPVLLRTELVGEIERPLLVLFGAVVLVLLIACVNVANLVLGRATARWKEVALRSALGASRWSLIRLLLIESVMLAVAGGGLGLLLASFGIDALIRINPDAIPGHQQIGVDGFVVAFTFGLSLLTGVLFGLVPAWQATGTDLNRVLREDGRTTSGTARLKLIRDGLVSVEIGISLVLLVGAGLLLQSFWKLLHVSPGFQAESVATCTVNLPRLKYPEPGQRADFFRRTVERLQSMPGIDSAAASTTVPFGGGRGTSSFSIDGRPTPPDSDGPAADRHQASPGYFGTMGIPILAGRDFSDADDQVHPGVVVINETAASQFWPGEDPIGKHLTVGMPDEVAIYGKPVSREIIGVIGNVKHMELHADFQPEIYMPAWQLPADNMTLLVRGHGATDTLIRAMSDAVQAMDKDQPTRRARLLETSIARSLAPQRFVTMLLMLFAAIALVLAAVGVYGVMSYTVAQRTHEIGIRIALGARAADVLKMVLGKGMLLAAIGVGGGLAASLGLTRLMQGLLFGISATDSLTFAAIAALLGSVALLACYVPARRATKVDPMVALRYE